MCYSGSSFSGHTRNTWERHQNSGAHRERQAVHKRKSSGGRRQDASMHLTSIDDQRKWGSAVDNTDQYSATERSVTLCGTSISQGRCTQQTGLMVS
ncbi:hypothetical protein EI94DRAFT_1745478, partial [Lactarius quietus]